MRCCPGGRENRSEDAKSTRRWRGPETSKRGRRVIYPGERSLGASISSRSDKWKQIRKRYLRGLFFSFSFSAEVRGRVQRDVHVQARAVVATWADTIAVARTMGTHGHPVANKAIVSRRMMLVLVSHDAGPVYLHMRWVRSGNGRPRLVGMTLVG